MSLPFIPLPGRGLHYTRVIGPLVAPGQPLTVEASGADIPSFTATVTAPEAIVLTAPVCNNNCGTVSKAAGLDVRWTTPTTGNVEIELNVSQLTLRCQVPASTQLKTIPSAALSLLPNDIGALVVGGAARTTVSAGGVTNVSFSVRDARYGVVTLTP